MIPASLANDPGSCQWCRLLANDPGSCQCSRLFKYVVWHLEKTIWAELIMLKSWIKLRNKLNSYSYCTLLCYKYFVGILMVYILLAHQRRKRHLWLPINLHCWTLLKSWGPLPHARCPVVPPPSTSRPFTRPALVELASVQSRLSNYFKINQQFKPIIYFNHANKNCITYHI